MGKVVGLIENSPPMVSLHGCTRVIASDRFTPVIVKVAVLGVPTYVVSMSKDVVDAVRLAHLPDTETVLLVAPSPLMVKAAEWFPAAVGL